MDEIKPWIMILLWKGTSTRVASLLKGQGGNAPRSSASLLRILSKMALVGRLGLKDNAWQYNFVHLLVLVWLWSRFASFYLKSSWWSEYASVPVVSVHFASVDFNQACCSKSDRMLIFSWATQLHLPHVVTGAGVQTLSQVPNQLRNKQWISRSINLGSVGHKYWVNCVLLFMANVSDSHVAESRSQHDKNTQACGKMPFWLSSVDGQFCIMIICNKVKATFCETTRLWILIWLSFQAVRHPWLRHLWLLVTFTSFHCLAHPRVFRIVYEMKSRCNPNGFGTLSGERIRCWDCCCIKTEMCSSLISNSVVKLRWFTSHQQLVLFTWACCLDLASL